MSHAKNYYNQPKVDLSKPPPNYVPRTHRRSGYSRTDCQNSSNQSTQRNIPNNRQSPASYKYAGEENVTRPGLYNASHSSAYQSNFENNFVEHYLLQPPPPPPPSVSPSTMYSFDSEATTPDPNQMYRNYGMYNASYSVPPPRFQTCIGASPAVSQRPQQFKAQYNRTYTGYNSRFGPYYNPYNRNSKLPQRPPHNSQTKNTNTNTNKKKTTKSVRTWSMNDARRALAVEKEYSKKRKNPSLIVKFPDKELNREVVSRMHDQIEKVYFQLPFTQRFCFVTLKDEADVTKVMKEMNQIQFGDGYLTVEPKKDKEEEIEIGPGDIDPLTLYVGNLAQEVTVEKIHTMYPNNKRVDIGYAKKMKHTRYAFVSFNTVDDAIEAYKGTCTNELYSKTLIVRFRRLNGTAGLPGEPKEQKMKKTSSSEGPAPRAVQMNPCDDDSSPANWKGNLYHHLKNELDDYYDGMVQNLDSLRLLDHASDTEFESTNCLFPDSHVPDVEPVWAGVTVKQEPIEDDMPSNEPWSRVKLETLHFTLPFVKEENEYDDKDKSPSCLNSFSD